jgi:hypothetical protein
MTSQSPPLDQIPDEEILSRFVLSKSWIRFDNSIKPNAFMPPPDLNLSVTASSQLSDDEIWLIGQDVAQNRPDGKLRGRADISALNARSQSLNAIANPIPNNIHHTHIVGWPTDKPLQKIIAQELADAARFLPNPNSETA